MTIELLRIVKKSGFKVVGMEHVCSRNESTNFISLTNMWHTFNKTLWMVENRINKNIWQKYGITYNSTGVNFTYMAAVPVSEFAGMPEHFKRKVIPTLTYVEFVHTGSLKNVYSSIKDIYKIHLIEMGIKPILQTEINLNHFEEYGRSFNWNNVNSKISILVPIDSESI